MELNVNWVSKYDGNYKAHSHDLETSFWQVYDWKIPVQIKEHYNYKG